MKKLNNYLFIVLLIISFTAVLFPQNSRGILTPYPGDPIFLNSSQTLNPIKMQLDAIDLNSAIVLGANYMKRMQADITEDNAGNGSGITETPNDPDDGGWDWVLTSPPAPFFHSTAASPKNLYGVCALGLYYSYLATNDATYFTAITDAANIAVGDIAIRDASVIKFLMLYNDLPEVAGTTYEDAARAKYDLRISSDGGGTATGFAQYIRDGRASLHNGVIGWDLGAYAVVAKMLFERFGGTYNTDASDIAEVLWQDSFNDNPGLFDVVDDAGWDPTYDNSDYWWYNLGISGLIDAFNSSGVHTAEIPWLVGQIKNSQYPSGAISYSYGAHTDDEDWQSTAYCISTLNDLNPTIYNKEINHAGYFLANTQDASGGWLYSNGQHYPEVVGENTTALNLAANYVYLSTGTSASAGFIYPNTNWGVTPYEGPNVDDWDFIFPKTVPLYIVPEVGSQFGACSITLEWDNTMFSLYSVINDGIFAPWPFSFQQSQQGSTSRLTIDASRTDLNNFNIVANDYIARVNFNLLKNGYGVINFTNLDFRYLDGANPPIDVYVTGNNAQVKSYLGDVASSTSTATGDGLVDINDLSPWATSYWSGVPGYVNGMANYKVKYDVGPTNTNTVYGMPATDGMIQFEDLVIFSMSYGLSQNHVYPKLNAQPTEPVELKLGDPIFAGNQTRVTLLVSGGVQNVRAMNLTFAGNFGKLVSVEKGELLTSISNPVMVMNNVEGNQVYVDLAVFGANEFGISTSGEVLTLVFEGNADININSANVRNILNGAMKVNFSGSVETIPTEFALLQNYPNPFNPSTTISYNLPKQALVEISMFNALGEKVAVLVNELKEAGRYNVEFNAAGMSSGIYFYQIKANDFVSVKKMMLMK